MRLALLLTAACACGGGGGGGKKATSTLPAVDEKTAEKDAKGLVTEIFDTLGRGNKDSLFSVLEEELVVFGPRKADAFANRADALVALGELIDPKAKKKVALRAGTLDVVPAPNGRSAWAVDVASVDGSPHAITAILINTDDIWQVGVAHVAHTPSKSELKSERDKDSVVPPGAMAKAKIDPDASAAVEKFKKGLLDQASWGAELASRSDAIVVGPASGEVTRGKKDIKKLWKKRTEAKYRAVTSGEIVAATTPDGELAWVTAPITRTADDETPLPLRAFAVFEKSNGEWKMIALHESVAVAEPGAGAAFKKVLPPKEPEKPAPVEEKTADKKKAKKKSAKKTKKAESDEEPPPKKKKKKKPPPEDE